MTRKMKVYVVGHSGPEHNSIQSVHRTYKGAFKSWDKLRVELLQNAKYFLKRAAHSKEMWQRIVKNLSCKDPKKINNSPHDTPYIREWKVEE